MQHSDETDLFLLSKGSKGATIKRILKRAEIGITSRLDNALRKTMGEIETNRSH